MSHIEFLIQVNTWNDQSKLDKVRIPTCICKAKCTNNPYTNETIWEINLINNLSATSRAND